jgi:hypothetical protein
MTYQAPVKDMLFVLNHLAGLPEVAALPGFEEATPDTARAVLEESARYAADVLAPLNHPTVENYKRQRRAFRSSRLRLGHCTNLSLG